MLGYAALHSVTQRYAVLYSVTTSIVPWPYFSIDIRHAIMKNKNVSPLRGNEKGSRDDPNDVNILTSLERCTIKITCEITFTDKK